MSGAARYDPVANPFAPGAGAPPPALVGRDDELAAARVALERARIGRHSQHLLIHGLRGVGKTVLLRAVQSTGEAVDYHAMRVEGDLHGEAVATLLRQCQRLLSDLKPTRRVRTALKVLSSVSLTVAGAGLRIDTDGQPGGAGLGSSGSLADDLPELFVVLAEAAADQDGGVLVLVDEAQALTVEQLAALLGSLHATDQARLPVWAALAGLPNLLGRAAKAKTYAERMFTVAELGPLPEPAATEAIVTPAAELGVSLDPRAAAAVVAEAGGYPYFLQSWAYHLWNVASDDPISMPDVDRARPVVRRALDEAFYAARLARVPPSEVRYVRALAELGGGAHRSSAVAERLGVTAPQVGAFRDRLIGEGLVYSPTYGRVAFAVPRFDEYLRRTFPPLAPGRSPRISSK